ncbi:MAG: VCBS domain-containing protein, partial [Methylovulum sp.]
MKTDSTATALAQTDTLSPAVQQPVELSTTSLPTAPESVADAALLSHFIDNVNQGLNTHDALTQAQHTVQTIAAAEQAVTVARSQQSVQMQRDNALATGDNINALLPEDSAPHANSFIAALNAALAEDTQPELAFAAAQTTVQDTDTLHGTLQTPLAENAQWLTSLATDNTANNHLSPPALDTANSDADIFSYHLLDELNHGQSIDTAVTEAQHVKQVLAQAQNTSVIPISDADAFISSLSNPAQAETQLDRLVFTSSQSEALQSALTNDRSPYEAVATANTASNLITSVETTLSVPSDPLLAALASGENVTASIAGIVPEVSSMVASEAQASPQDVEATINFAFDKGITLTEAVKEAQVTTQVTDKVLLEVQAVTDSPEKALIQALASGENISTALTSVMTLAEQNTNSDSAANAQLFAENLSDALAQGGNINTAILNAQTEMQQQTLAERAVQLPQQPENAGLLLALATGNALNQQPINVEVLNALTEQIQQQPGEVSLEKALTLAQQHINLVIATLTDIKAPQATSAFLGLLSGNERIAELIQALSSNPELLIQLERLAQTTTFEAMQQIITNALESAVGINSPLERAVLALNEAKTPNLDSLLSSPPEQRPSPITKLTTVLNTTAVIEHSPSLINIFSLLHTMHQLFEEIQIKDAVSLVLIKQENALQNLTELYTLLEANVNAMEAFLKLNISAEHQFNLLQQAINLNRYVTQALFSLNAIPLRAEEAGGVANMSSGINPSGNFFIALGISPTEIKFIFPDKVVQPFIVLTGTYGQLTLYLNGTYIYELTNTDQRVEALTSATYLIDTFENKLINQFGDSAVIKVSIIIKGANDAPNAVNDTGVATEAGGVSLGTNATGNVLSNDTDIDSNDTKALSTASIGTFTGSYGALTLNADGSYVYVIDNTNATVNALNITDTLVDTFSYTLLDAAGLTSTASLSLSIQGANDAPNAVNDTGVATEAGGISLGTNATGNVLSNDTDIDANDIKSLSTASIGTFTG